MNSLGIDIGSTSLKLVLLEGESIKWNYSAPHEGNYQAVLESALRNYSLPADLKAVATGTEGRLSLAVNNVIGPVCVEEALKNSGLSAGAVVSLGGEDLIVYTVDQNSRIISSISGNKCASGTGEFFKQQLGRMNMRLDDIPEIPDNARVCKLSSRCSVFMKSDCTHKLNKKEATKEDIVVSLSDVMATKVIDFLKRARISSGRVILTGGVTYNKFIIGFIRKRLPTIEFIIPETAPYFEAYGAAVLARKTGSIMPAPDKLMKKNRVYYERFPALTAAQEKVSFLPSRKGMVKAGREYILGVDGGSTTTKACLIDMETSEITASHYGRTHGDPVAALKICLMELKKQIKKDTGGKNIKISLASATGSSREILGVFLETAAVYNEIIAHAAGTTFYQHDIDTIFEIGGQDAKYTLLKNKVPIDYAMNEACSAGTGSFLEESASGDLNITDAALIGGIAVKATAPLKFGEHCSAFINSDIRKAVQQGASKEDITAGIVLSIVSNYLNRVTGNRTIGSKISLQGGVAKNKAVPLAFAMLLNKDILVPPDPELLGCFGAGILAKQKHSEGLPGKSSFDIDKIINTEIIYESEFKCGACENFCPIKVLKVNSHKYMFGGRCNKYTGLRNNDPSSGTLTKDYIEMRSNLLFHECAPEPGKLIKKRDFIVGIPKVFSVHTLYPLYAWFFHELGVETVLSKNISHEGTSRIESAYCFPAEIAHGAFQDMIDRGADYIFLPHFKYMPSYEKKVHANFCPITQALPYYLKKAFPETPGEKILCPVISFGKGLESGEESFTILAKTLGFSRGEGARAFRKAVKKQTDFMEKASALGRQALEEARKAEKPVIAVFGRPYNAFTPEANMCIPRKFTSRGFTVIPFDILPFHDEEIFDNMYWYYGQQNIKAARFIKKEPNIYLTYITNFSCAPDSFLLHYVRWTMGIKPFLVLELDSHTADAGVDTRVEAFLDIIEGYKSKLRYLKDEKYDNGLRLVNNGREEIHIKNILTGKKIKIKNNPGVKLLLPNMGRLSSEFSAAAIRGSGFNAEAVPVATIHTLQLARNLASGKECVPSLLVLGSVLQFINSKSYRKEEIYMSFVPITTGPCRTGQYYIFYENLFRDLRIDNIVFLTLSSDNSYNELGPNFSKNIWWSMVVADYMKDIETTLRTCAVDPVQAMKIYDEHWRSMIKIAEKDMTKIIPMLRKTAFELKQIPLKKRPEECPKVLVVGEIYVRRDDFAVDELIRHFSKKGIIGKISGITEWIYYCDHVREYQIKKELKKRRFFNKIFSKPMKDYIFYKIEQMYKHFVEHKVRKALGGRPLLPGFPHNMYRIMNNANGIFVSSELNSEISVSSGAAVTAMMEDYSGIVNTYPFACLIGRVIEGLITPYFREKRMPVLSVEIDGNLLPPTIVNKLDIFMLNVLRCRSNPDVSDLVERE